MWEIIHLRHFQRLLKYNNTILQARKNVPVSKYLEKFRIEIALSMSYNECKILTMEDMENGALSETASFPVGQTTP